MPRVPLAGLRAGLSCARTNDLLVDIERWLETRVPLEGFEHPGVAAALEELSPIGALGIRIPREHGGLGLGHVAFSRVLQRVARRCRSTAVALSAHQGMGLSNPLMLFGTEAQKRRYLPRLARGTIAATALTEAGAGSDPSRLEATATPSADGRAFVIRGEKSWCTNGPIAGLFLVFAAAGGSTSAFVVERDTEGLGIGPRCRFMGLDGLESCVLRLDDVRVSTHSVLGSVGEGLRILDQTGRTGRLGTPAIAAGAARWCLGVARRWVGIRHVSGRPLGSVGAVASKLAYIASHTFALEAIALVTAGLADSGVDTAIESSMAKIFAGEHLWRIADETLQLRGARGYETASSQAARGEDAVGIERALRDARALRILQGSTEALRARLAPSVVAMRALLAGPVEEPGIPETATVCAALAAEQLRASRGPLSRRMVDLATELFVLRCVGAYADEPSVGARNVGAAELANVYGSLASCRLDALLRSDDEPRREALGKRVVDARFTWLERSP